jgi:amino acid transporter
MPPSVALPHGTLVEPATTRTEDHSYGLRHQVLSPIEVLGQSIANIAPTGTPVLVIPLVFAAAGKATWFAYLFGLVGILFVSGSINQFARRSASPGSIYTYIAQGLGPHWGIAAGWALLIAYIGCAASVTTGFANYVNVLLKDIFALQDGLPAAGLTAVILLSVLGSWFVAYRDIKLSARLSLGLELASLAFIVVVIGATLVNRGASIDFSQLELEGLTLDKLRLGLVLAIFSFTGFESAASLGSEAARPLRSIPRAVLQSVLLVGVLFVVSSYVEVAGFIGSDVTLDASDAPLQVLASRAGIGSFGVAITIGAIFSFFACVLASVNSAARILFLMSRHGVFTSSVGDVHANNRTPHVAVAIVSVLAFLPAGILAWFGNGMFDIYGWIGTTATLGFILIYIVVSIAAPVYLYRRGELRPRHVVVPAIAIVFMAVALVGAVYPLPEAPAVYPIYAFLALLAGGVLWGLVLRFAVPAVHGRIHADLSAIRARFNDAGDGI